MTTGLFSLLMYSSLHTKLKTKLDLGFGQPKGFLSAKVQDDWQLENKT